MAKRRRVLNRNPAEVPCDLTLRGRPAPPVQAPAKLPDEPDEQLLTILAEAEAELDRQQEAREQQREEEAFADYIAPDAVSKVLAVTAELARRKVEALKLYEPMPVQDAFHRSATRVRLGIGSNRSGKTSVGAVEIARAVTGQDPYDKYPKKDGRCFCVALNLEKAGDILWRKLGRSGAFKIIRDLGTKQWRAFRPWDALDLARAHDAKPAPPLIPPRLIKNIAWENKGKGIPKKVLLHNGWEINFYSSEGFPPQGHDIDLAWLDEEIANEAWFPELRMRILDRKGRIIWTATPQAGSDHLFQLHERAEEEAAKDAQPRSVEEFKMLLFDNPHIDADEKKAVISDVVMGDANQYRVRILGEFAFTSFKVYPEFSMDVQGVEHFEVPQDWCRFLVVDPGHQVCACLFAAVPPPHVGDYVDLYDELYLKECDAAKFAEEVGRKVEGAAFQAFIIDYHGSIRNEGGVGKSLFQQYQEALAARKVKSLATGSGFVFGSDDVDAGIMAVHGWLRRREDQTTKLRVHKGVLPNFEREMKYYRKKRVGGEVVDKPLQRNNHMPDALRYLAMFNPKYVRPPVGQVRPGGAYAAFQKKMQRKREAAGAGKVWLGPGRALAS